MERETKLFIVLVVGSLAYYFLYFLNQGNCFLNPRRIVSEDAGTERSNLTAEIEKEKLVLLYTAFYGIPDWSANFTNCRYKCRVTRDRGDLASSDAVLFDLLSTYNTRVPIPPRDQSLQDQIRVFAVIESPGVYTTQFSLGLYDNVFNWSMTYRRDSDFPTLHGNFVPLLGNEDTENEIPNITSIKKRRLVAGMISRCNAESGRDAYIAQLKKVIPVDLYGDCGSYTCSKTEECYKLLSPKYKFWLSFENSICRDYITEKFFAPIEYGTVPIVFGYGPYSEAAPVGSYINVQDFSSAQELGHYLLHLDSHPEEYLKYFEWKKRFRINTQIVRDQWCGFCEKLHRLDVDRERKWYARIDDWYRRNNTNVSLCLTAQQFVSLYSHSTG